REGTQAVGVLRGRGRGPGELPLRGGLRVGRAGNPILWWMGGRGSPRCRGAPGAPGGAAYSGDPGHPVASSDTRAPRLRGGLAQPHGGPGPVLLPAPGHLAVGGVAPVQVDPVT